MPTFRASAFVCAPAGPGRGFFSTRSAAGHAASFLATYRRSNLPGLARLPASFTPRCASAAIPLRKSERRCSGRADTFGTLAETVSRAVCAAAPHADTKFPGTFGNTPRRYTHARRLRLRFATSPTYWPRSTRLPGPSPRIACAPRCPPVFSWAMREGLASPTRSSTRTSVRSRRAIGFSQMTSWAYLERRRRRHLRHNHQAADSHRPATERDCRVALE